MAVLRHLTHPTFRCLGDTVKTGVHNCQYTLSLKGVGTLMYEEALSVSNLFNNAPRRIYRVDPRSSDEMVSDDKHPLPMTDP
jgi:hypothetical protein